MLYGIWVVSLSSQLDGRRQNRVETSFHARIHKIYEWYVYNKVKKKNIPELIVKERFSKANLIQFFRRDR